MSPSLLVEAFDGEGVPGAASRTSKGIGLRT